MDSTSASPNINCSSSKIYHGSPAPSGDARRELEKSLLVRQLKSQIMILRGAVAEREIEIETLRRSQKGSKIAELLNEKEEYFLETVRLKQAATELRDALQHEKLQNSWNMKRNGARNEVCREVSGVTSVHRSTMKGVVQSSDSKTRTTKSRIVTTINANQTTSKRCMKAGSRSVIGESRQFHSSGALKPSGQLPHSTSSLSLEEDKSNVSYLQRAF